jgi:DNA topoisomerase-6 subunit B
MVVFVHMASVWVPFTSESKEAIADYDEIRKEIKLALQECGRRLGVFLRRRERAKGEFRRRNIFELYIEEVVEACARLKGGKLAKDKLRTQLQKIATKRTGGPRTDEILGLDGGPDGLPHSIVVTAEGPEGDAPGLPEQGAVATPDEAPPDTERHKPARRGDAAAPPRRGKAGAGKTATAGRPERAAGPTAKAATSAARATSRTAKAATRAARTTGRATKAPKPVAKTAHHTKR